MNQLTYRVFAVSSWGALAFLAGDLHQALLTGTTDSVGVAGALLHRERCEEDGRDFVLRAVLFKRRDILCARLERTGLGLQRCREGLGYDILDVDLGRRPAPCLETTVQVIDMAVGSSELGCGF